MHARLVDDVHLLYEASTSLHDLHLLMCSGGHPYYRFETLSRVYRDFFKFYLNTKCRKHITEIKIVIKAIYTDPLIQQVQLNMGLHRDALLVVVRIRTHRYRLAYFVYINYSATTKNLYCNIDSHATSGWITTLFTGKRYNGIVVRSCIYC